MDYVKLNDDRAFHIYQTLEEMVCNPTALNKIKIGHNKLETIIAYFLKYHK